MSWNGASPPQQGPDLLSSVSQAVTKGLDAVFPLQKALGSPQLNGHSRRSGHSVKFYGMSGEDGGSEHSQEDHNAEATGAGSRVRYKGQYIDSMTVVTLRKYLKKLGLPVVGKKADLMERLAAAVVNRQDSDEEDLVDASVDESDQNPEGVEDSSEQESHEQSSQEQQHSYGTRSASKAGRTPAKSSHARTPVTRKSSRRLAEQDSTEEQPSSTARPQRTKKASPSKAVERTPPKKQKSQREKENRREPSPEMSPRKLRARAESDELASKMAAALRGDKQLTPEEYAYFMEVLQSRIAPSAKGDGSLVPHKQQPQAARTIEHVDQEVPPSRAAPRRDRRPSFQAHLGRRPVEPLVEQGAPGQQDARPTFQHPPRPASVGAIRRPSPTFGASYNPFGSSLRSSFSWGAAQGSAAVQRSKRGLQPEEEKSEPDRNTLLQQAASRSPDRVFRPFKRRLVEEEDEPARTHRRSASTPATTVTTVTTQPLSYAPVFKQNAMRLSARRPSAGGAPTAPTSHIVRDRVVRQRRSATPSASASVAKRILAALGEATAEPEAYKKPHVERRVEEVQPRAFPAMGLPPRAPSPVVRTSQPEPQTRWQFRPPAAAAPSVPQPLTSTPVEKRLFPSERTAFARPEELDTPTVSHKQAPVEVEEESDTEVLEGAYKFRAPTPVRAGRAVEEEFAAKPDVRFVFSPARKPGAKKTARPTSAKPAAGAAAPAPAPAAAAAPAPAPAPAEDTGPKFDLWAQKPVGVKCDACYVMNKEDALKCVSCETVIQVKCASCGKLNRAKNDECSQCKAKLTKTAGAPAAASAPAFAAKPAAGSIGAGGFSFKGAGDQKPAFISSSGFKFGVTSDKESEAGKTAAPAPAPAPAAAKPTGAFSFGAVKPAAAPSAAGEAKPAFTGFSFGKPPAADAKPVDTKEAASPAKPSAAPASTPAPAPAPAPATTDKQESKPAFSFGAKKETTEPAAKPSFGFSIAPQKKPEEETSTAPPAATAGFKFGSSIAAPAPAPAPAPTPAPAPAPAPATSEAASKPAVTFGSTSGAAPAFSFGATAKTPATSSATPAPAFSFGTQTTSAAPAPASAPAPAPAFSFGAASTGATAPTSTATSATTTAPAAAKPAFSFGATSTPAATSTAPTTAPTTTTAAAPATTTPAFTFGSSTTPASTGAAPAFTFGSKPAATPAVNAAAPAPAPAPAPAAAPFSFGSTQFGAGGAAPAFKFGAASGASPAPAPAPAATPAFKFGGASSAAPPLKVETSMSTFNTQSQPSPVANDGNESDGGMVFGNDDSMEATSLSTAPVAIPSSTPSTGFAFGATQQPQQAAAPFGAGSGPAFAFGATPTPAAKPTTFQFGATNGAAAAPAAHFTGFGSGAGAAPTGPAGFAPAKPAAPAFGGAAPAFGGAAAPAFGVGAAGAAPAGGPVFNFGASAPSKTGPKKKLRPKK